MTSNRIPSLDGVRALAVLLVIAGHFQDKYAHQSGLSILLAALGVHVFFVLSGYLITTLLQQEQRRYGNINLVAFYRRRCFRIFPAAFTYILVIALLIPVSRSGLLYAITYSVCYHPFHTPGVFWHLWSLSVEEQFYLLWPVALVLGYRHRAAVAWSTIVIAALTRFVITLKAPPHFFISAHHCFPTTMDSIAAGCLLAIYEEQIKKKLGSLSQSTALVGILPVVICIWAAVCWNEAMTLLWGTVPLAIALWMLLLIQRRDRSLNNAIASTLGILSYSVYLWQQPFTELNGFSLSTALLSSALCAVASYVLVEKPMLRLGRRTTNATNSGLNDPITA